MMLSARRHVRFLQQYLRSPKVVGAVAPSSPALARALAAPYAAHGRPARVLEVGAGTGAVTRHLGTLLGPQDELDVCEIEPAFVETLQHDILSAPAFAPALSEGRVRVLPMAVQALPREPRYDFVISGLPLTAFSLRDVREVFAVVRSCLKPGGVFSYFEYVALRAAARALAWGPERRRLRYVSAYLTRRIRAHQVRQCVVLPNLPPAWARHLQFGTEKGA